MNYNLQELENEFLQILQSRGIPPHDGVVIADGKKQRYRIEGDKAREKNGEYRIYVDDYPAGYSLSYSAKHDAPYMTWSFSGNRMSFSEEEKRKFREERERVVRQRTEEDAQKRRYAAMTAKKMWENATTDGVSTHPYIIKKDIQNVSGVKLFDRDLIISFADGDGEIHSLQKISPNGEKRFHTGGRKYGCFHRLQGNGRFVFVCEGLATALSVRDVTGCSCVVAGDSNNLAPVISSLKDTNLILIADNDVQKQGNPGLSSAIEAAAERCIPVIVPEFDNPSDGTDFNDLVKLRGVEQTCEDIFRQIEHYSLDTSKRTRFVFPDLAKSKSGTSAPLGTFENLDYLVKYHKYGLRYNEISHEVEMNIPHQKYGADNQRNAALADIHSLMAHTSLRIPDKTLKGYIHKVADANSYNPAREWVLREKWNGNDSISALCDTLTFAPNTPVDLTRSLIKKWLISAVAAAFSRGFDDIRPFWSRGVLVLHGPQAIGKTSWLRRLAPNSLFAEGLSLSLDDKDSLRRAVSAWIVELGELDGTFKRTDIARLKAFISSQYDEIRRPYAESAEKLSRRTVFCASVNRSDILHDETGSSRWWICPLVSCDARHNVNIGQVWAQAHNLYLEGESWWLSREEEVELSSHNEDFVPASKYDDLVPLTFNFANYDWSDTQNTTEMTATEVVRACGIHDAPHGDASLVGKTLRRLTGHPCRRIAEDGRRVHRMPNKRFS